MARKVLRQTVPIATALVLTATMFFAVGWWRRSEDVNWCREAAAGGVVTGGQPSGADLLDEVRSACTVQRRRQRVMFGAVWRTGGRETAQCGFELARMQLVSYQDRNAYQAVLQRYGVDHVDFDPSNRADQDRFAQACLATGQQQAG